MGRADLHMHTTASDGVADVRTMLEYAAEYRQLDVLAITDHDRIESSLWAASQQGRYPFDIVPGMEVTSADGHVLALWVHKLVPKGLSLAETAAAIHEQGGIAVLAHPFEPTIAPHTFWRYLTRPSVLQESGMDAIEIFNAGAFTPGCNWLAARVYGRFGLPVVGNSDAHAPAQIATGITRFAGHTAADLRQALAARQTIAEGKPWRLTVYLQLYRTYRQMKRSACSGMSVPSTHPIQP
jgi:hypothetical protein